MKKENKSIEKFYYDVKMEVMLPATVVYRVYAENAEKALEEVRETTAPVSVQHRLVKKKIKKAMVYDAGCSTLKHVRNYN